MPPPTDTAGTSIHATPADWIAGLHCDDIPAEVLARAQDLLLDTLGVAIAAARVPAARIAHDMAAHHFCAASADAGVRLPFDGRPVSIPGAAYATATSIDNLDAHDGYQPAKGHAGVGLVAGLLSMAQRAGNSLSGRDVLAALVAGYEIACRAGTTLRETTAEYHSSGAWNALGVAALGSRLHLPGAPAVVKRALGIAEYHAPRAPMMREIDHPSMLHDSSGWGALAGATAVLLAGDGLSASPAELPAHAGASTAWADLGERWLVPEQYVKPHPVCFWAQPAVRAALHLRSAHAVSPGDIARIRIDTFHEATRLAAGVPATTEAAQYALAFPVAAALERGRVGPDEIAGSGLTDERIHALTGRMEVHERPEFSGRFPDERLAEVTLTLANGNMLASGETQPRGVPGNPLDRAAVIEKFRQYTDGLIEPDRQGRLVDAVMSLHEPEARFAAVLEACVDAVDE